MSELDDLIAKKRAEAQAATESTDAFVTQQEAEMAAAKARHERILRMAPLIADTLLTEKGIQPDMTLHTQELVPARRGLKKVMENVTSEFATGWTMDQCVGPRYIDHAYLGREYYSHGLMLATDGRIVGYKAKVNENDTQQGELSRSFDTATIDAAGTDSGEIDVLGPWDERAHRRHGDFNWFGGNNYNLSSIEEHLASLVIYRDIDPSVLKADQ